ncbi:hypothetical protein AQUCO_01400437v1 [Aquilegia coerulea]|uniref:Agenet domain-containing protein n=1 Tax=Aquilegia coerulea TaxID=218851 RepID=A0A2G5DWD2_AQUCA|nr:hypothetical protein AQUCO_01400437v1 [Aquilegia coerulea]
MPRKKFEFITGQEVEVKTIEKRIEEIWYVGKIVGISEEKTKRNKYLVEYPTSVKNPLANCIPHCRLRPLPPSPTTQETKNQQFQLNEVVDAFYNDGWWKGVVSKIPSEGYPWYSVFFKDEQKAVLFRRYNLRVHFDWINGKWFTSQNKETEVLAQNVGSFLTLIPTDISVCGNDMDVSQTPNEMMDSSSTPNKTQAEMIAIAQNDGTFLAPIQTGSSSDMDISQTPSGFGEILLEECPEALTSTIPCHDDQWQKKQHAGLPTTQMKEPSHCTEIKLHGRGGVGKQLEVFKRRRGRRIGSVGPEDEVSSEELTVDQMETTQLLNTPVEDCPPLLTCLERSNSPIENDNREVSPDNQLIPTVATAQISASLENLALLESSNEFDNLFLGEYTTLDALLQYDEVTGDERGTHSADIAAISTSLVQHAEGHMHDANLPFVKSSPLWETFEGIEVLQLMPQHPHFRPVEQYDEEFREGYAIENLVNFVNLAKDILKAKLEEPRSVFENRLKALAELEEHGFTVDPLRFQLKEFLRIKDSYTELDINSKTVERELTEEKLKYNELQDSVTQLKMKLKPLMMDKELIETDVADQQKKVAEFKEIIKSLKREFDNMVASAFVSTFSS